MKVTHGGNIFEFARRRGCDWHDVLDFSASINPLGPAPGVNRAIVNALDRIVHYPEREPTHLKESLASKWGITSDQILLGNGATELIYFLARIFSQTPVHLHVPVFSEFHRAFPRADLIHSRDPDKWPSSGVLVLTRPENPTGYMQNSSELTDWLSRTEHPVIIDESFIEFSGTHSLVGLVEQHPNLIVLRSLTKFYALPGLRIGALVASKSLVRQWQASREPWQVNVLASAAAIAALEDDHHAARSLAFIEEEREWISGQLRLLKGVSVQPSQANFLFIRLNYSAASFCEFLVPKNILVRNCAAWPGINGESIRIAIRTREENMRLLDTWRSF